MLSNQQLYLLNHFAFVARRHGLRLPDLNDLMHNEARLQEWIDIGLSELTKPAVMDAAAKLAATLRGQATSVPHAKGTSPRDVPGLSPKERDLALAALQDVAGPIASLIVERLDAMGPMSLDSYLDHAAALAQLNATRRRSLRAACGLAPDRA